jgi:peptidoglycan/LPS O-acetylase OafA/YrhL
MIRSRNHTLDLIRALAALEVMVSHLQPLIFDFHANHSEPHYMGLPVRVFYYATCFGHQAVTVFFVLSGYFVGGSVIAAKPEGFWRRFLIQRVSRLWIVLLPSLALTFVWNMLDFHYGGAAYLNGSANPITGPAQPVHLDVLTFLGNAFFLQTIYVPHYGDNGALWSLAPEFWYYIIFPLLFFGVGFGRSVKLWRRVAMLLAGVGLIVISPRDVLVGFVIWLFGAEVAALENRPLGAIFAGWKVGIPSVFACGLLLHLSHYEPETAGVRLGIGFSLAVACPWIIRVVKLTPPVGKIAAWFSDFSYTLYLVHTSFMAFVWCAFFHSERLAPGGRAFVRFAFFGALVVAYSYGCSLLFERNTDKLRRFLTRRLSPG